MQQAGGLREYESAEFQFLTLIGLEKVILFVSVLISERGILGISERAGPFSETETDVSKAL